ncbi:M48 family metallopeptidase [Leeia sp. TBRC 13508]|uniref:M48 family metallopeptidase n=1 Tax=Leeia speluncae TaxID=2884804 RepID=A0ABS8D8S9_9NEIS|nr:M48 family metallopeptidase [Leeia speluncae]MCB6184627.1 M48 family metallopeptidase [Leeia speluncae]
MSGFTTFSYIFIALVIFTALLQLWLSHRQLWHVATHRAEVPSAFATDISLADHQKAADYTITKLQFSRLTLLVDVVWTLALTIGGVLSGVYQLTGKWFSSPIWHPVAAMVVVMLIQGVIGLPASLWKTFRIEAAFGFNRLTVKLFFLDLIKGAVVGTLIGVPFLAAALWLLKSMGAYWWVYVWAMWLSFNLLMLAVYPTFIAPLFNKFTPLEDEALKARIEGLLKRCGFASSGVFVMDGSKRSSHGNAYFTGFGSNKRIVFFDTLIERLTPEEIEAVLAHELGHFKHKHIVKRMVWMFGSALVALGIAGWAVEQPWLYTGLGVSQQDTALGLFLFFIVAPLVTLPLGPLSSYYSRKHEFEADAFAASQSDAKDLISGLVKLYRDNASTLTPDPLHSAFYDSHPPASLRIAALEANQKKA